MSELARERLNVVRGIARHGKTEGMSAVAATFAECPIMTRGSKNIINTYDIIYSSSKRMAVLMRLQKGTIYIYTYIY